MSLVPVLTGATTQRLQGLSQVIPDVHTTAEFRNSFETSLNSEERSLPLEPASEIPPGEVGSSIAAQVAVIIQTNKVRMPTAAIVMQQADVMENQYQVPRYRSTCNYGFSDLRYEYMT